MENNILHSTNILNTEKFRNIAETLSDNLKRHFSKITIVSIFISAIICIFKISNIISRNKKLAIEMNGICELERCSPKDLFVVLEKDYNDLVKHIKTSYKYPDSIMKRFDRYSKKGSDGNRFFIGEEGLSVYSHALIASEYKCCKHPIKGFHINNIIHMPCKHKFFEAVKHMGGPAPGIKGAYAISKIKFLKFIEEKSRDRYGEDANYICFIGNSYEQFKEELVEHKCSLEEFDHEIIGKFGIRTYVALPKGAKEKYHWVGIESANKLDLDIEDVCISAKCDPKDVIKLPKEKYKKLTDHIKTSPFKNEIMESLENNIRTGSSDHVFFAGKKAISAYYKAIVSSGYCEEHPLKGDSIDRLYYLDSEHESFESLKDLGAPIPSETHGYVISRYKYLSIIECRARYEYGPDATFAGFSEDLFDTKFKKGLNERGFDKSNIEYKIIGEIDLVKHVAFPPGSKEKYDWISIHSAREEDGIERNNIEIELGDQNGK